MKSQSSSHPPILVVYNSVGKRSRLIASEVVFIVQQWNPCNVTPLLHVCGYILTIRGFLAVPRRGDIPLTTNYVVKPTQYGRATI